MRIWVRDVEFGTPRVAGALEAAFRISEGVGRLLEVLLELAPYLGFGVTLRSPEGSRNLVGGGFMGVFFEGLASLDASDIGGDGGVGVSETVSEVDTDLVSGGVVIIGEDATDVGDPPEYGEASAAMSVSKDGSWRAVAFSSLSCAISASIFRSDSSSRNLCVSIRKASLSCSPILISSSIITARSIATLYFDSKSSMDEEVFLACLSKSSFATSISLSFSCRVLFVSRSVVISFCKVFCAAFASDLDCLYLVYMKY